MASLVRKLFSRGIRQLRHRKYCSAVLKVNEDFVIHSPIRDIVIKNMRVLDRLWIYSSNFKNHVAIESAETNKKYTYNELQRNTAAYATSLRKKLGLNQGDVVSAMLPNCPEFAVVTIGTLQAGCVLTTINPIYKEFEISHQVTITEPKVLIVSPEHYDVAVKGLKQAKSNARIIIVDNPADIVPEGTIRFSDAEKGETDYALLDRVETRQEDVAFIPFSSGTTGLPKGVEITYRNLLAAMEMMDQKENSFPELTHGKYQEVVPCILPFFHIYGMVITLLGHLAKGCKLITVNKFSANLYFDVLKREEVSLLYVVPPIAILLGKHPDVKPELFRNVRHIICGAAPLSATDVEAVMEKSQKYIEFNQGFGATETSACTTTTMIGTRVLDHSACGAPMASVTLKFVDPLTGKDLPIGKSGEMYVKAPSVMKGYHKNEEATRDSLTEDGYFKTGDLGHYDLEKGLFITDRIKELIKVKGMQVAPAELESVLRSHPSVADAAVIGVPHDFYGEIPKAFVVKKNAQQVSEEDLQEFVAAKVAPFKRIEEVMFVENIPKTASGKILRKDLKNMYT